MEDTFQELFHFDLSGKTFFLPGYTYVLHDKTMAFNAFYRSFIAFCFRQ